MSIALTLIVIFALIAATASYFDNKASKAYAAKYQALIDSVKPDTVWVISTESDNPWVNSIYIAKVVSVKNGYLQYVRGDHDEIGVMRVETFVSFYKLKRN